MNDKRIVTTLIASLLLLSSFSSAAPDRGEYWRTPGNNTPTGDGSTNSSLSSVDKNLCITVFGVISLALVVYLFKKKTFRIAENESVITTASTKKSKDFNVSN